MTATPWRWSSGAIICRPDPAKGEARQIVITLRARAIVFATGATERPLVFANNDRPGVMLASAVRTYLNRFAVAPRPARRRRHQQRQRLSHRLRPGGSGRCRHPRRSARQAPIGAGQAEAKQHGIELLRGMAVGRRRRRQGRQRGRRWRRWHGGASASAGDCDVLCMSGGWSPARASDLPHRHQAALSRGHRGLRSRRLRRRPFRRRRAAPASSRHRRRDPRGLAAGRRPRRSCRPCRRGGADAAGAVTIAGRCACHRAGLAGCAKRRRARPSSISRTM